MTFQFACRKWLNHKDLEPASPDSWIQYTLSSIQYRESRIENQESNFSSLFTPSHLYICRERSTNQLFFNKQTQFPKSSNERKYLLYKELSNFYPAGGAKNKPNSNPIKPNFKKAKMNVKLTLTKDYRKKDDFAVRKNKPNFQNAKNERKLTYNKGLQKKRWFRSPKKQTQFPKCQKWA